MSKFTNFLRKNAGNLALLVVVILLLSGANSWFTLEPSPFRRVRFDGEGLVSSRYSAPRLIFEEVSLLKGKRVEVHLRDYEVTVETDTSLDDGTVTVGGRVFTCWSEGCRLGYPTIYVSSEEEQARWQEVLDEAMRDIRGPEVPLTVSPPRR